MTDTKISALTAASSLASTDKLVIASSGTSKSHAGNLVPGFRIGYTEFTSPVTVSATTEGSPTSVVTLGALTYANVEYRFEFFTPRVDSGSGTAVNIVLYDSTTSLGVWGVHYDPVTPSFAYTPVALVRYLTPSAGSHTYNVGAYRAASNGTIQAGVGGTAAYVPGFLRVTVA